MMIEGRFSRRAVAAALSEQIEAAAAEFESHAGRRPDPEDGAAQVPRRGDHETLRGAAMAYGRWRALVDVLAGINA